MNWFNWTLKHETTLPSWFTVNSYADSRIFHIDLIVVINNRGRCIGWSSSMGGITNIVGELITAEMYLAKLVNRRTGI